MSTLITVGNNYYAILEEFIYPSIDISNPDEVTNAAQECIEAYLDMHHDLRVTCPDRTDEEIFEACFYLIEEVCDYES